MTTYPDIQRRDGTLFFACPDGDKNAIATSIERLIDLLDAMEDDPDLEPYLAGYASAGGDDREGDLDADECDDKPDEEPSCGWTGNVDQTYCSAFSHSPNEEEDGAAAEPSIGTAVYAGDGRFEYDLEADTADSEPALGWTDKIDQSGPITHTIGSNHDDEPDLGWTGHGCGVRDGEVHLDTERNGDELDFNGDEGDHSGFQEEFGTWGTAARWTGEGADDARDMIRGMPLAARRAAAYAALPAPVVYQFGRGFSL